MLEQALNTDTHRKIHRGSGVIGIQSTNGVVFDSIVYGERTPQAWMAGSDTLKRSQKHDGEKEELAKEKPIHIAITYSKNGTITRYREGQVYGETYKTEFQSFEKGNSQIIFGMRHGTKSAPTGYLWVRLTREFIMEFVTEVYFIVHTGGQTGMRVRFLRLRNGFMRHGPMMEQLIRQQFF